MALWHCGEPTCTWTVAAWRLHTPFSLGITIVFSLSADASQMVCYRIKCKVALNWSVALSYAHVVCARLFITWSALITPNTQSHTHTPTHPPNAPFRHAVSPHISEQNWTNWQWCLLIFSIRVNLVKQDGPRIYKYRRRKGKLRPW